MLGDETATSAVPPVADKRFKDSEWSENAVFSYIRDSYLLSARAILSSVRGVKGLDELADKLANCQPQVPTMVESNDAERAEPEG